MSRYDNDSFDFEDFMHHTLSRRDALKIGGLAAGGAGLLAACSSGGTVNPDAKDGGGGNGGGGGGGGGANDSVPQQAATIPTPRKQTLIVAQGTFASYGVYNPFIPNTDYATGFGQVVKEYPFYLNLTKSTDNLINWQWTGWEYNKDYTQITFHLDPNVHWSDGKPHTSADVKFTIEMFQKQSSLTGATGNWVTEAKSITTPDDHTVVIGLTKRDTRYHYDYICSVVNAAFLCVPQHIWQGKDPTTFKNESAVFTGPYKLKEANRTLQYYLWEKDPNYWNKAKLDPKPQYVAYLTAPAADAAAEDFKNAKIDQGGADYVHAQALIKNGYKKAIITSMEDPCLRSIHVNCDPSKGILADHRMRWVISCLMDRETYAKSIWSPPTEPATYPWPGYPYMKPYEDQSIASQFPLSYNPQKAEQLLGEIGAKKGSDGKWSFKGKKLSFTIITPSVNTGYEYLIGQTLAKEMTKIGIPTDIKALTGAGVYNGEVAKGTYDIRSEWGPCSTSDPYQTYVSNTSKFYVPVGKQATTGDQERLKDPKLDALTAQLANADPAAAAAKPIFAKALQEWYTQMPVIPSIKTVYTHQQNTTYWEGWPTDDDLYMVPNSWWGQFMFVVGALKPAGS